MRDELENRFQIMQRQIDALVFICRGLLAQVEHKAGPDVRSVLDKFPDPVRTEEAIDDEARK